MTTNSAELKPCLNEGLCKALIAEFYRRSKKERSQIVLREFLNTIYAQGYQAGRSAAHEEQSKAVYECDGQCFKCECGRMDGQQSHAGSAEPISDGDREFITKRLRRVAKIVGLESAIPDGDNLIECAGSVLGMIASKLEQERNE